VKNLHAMKVQKADLVKMARQFIIYAIELLEKACEGNGRAQASIINHLKVMKGPDTGHLSLALNLEDLMERYKGQEIEVDDEWYHKFDGMS
jgi:hypothetical protein